MKQKTILISAAVLIVLSVATYQYISVRKTNLVKIESLSQDAQKEKSELVELYQKRAQLLVDWEKSLKKTNKKAKSPLELPDSIRNTKATWNLGNANDLAQFDQFQNTVTQFLSLYLTSDESKKYKPQGLEKLEEQINRKRHAYHSTAFDANELISRYQRSHPEIPAFRAEQEIYKAGQWSKNQLQ